MKGLRVGVCKHRGTALVLGGAVMRRLQCPSIFEAESFVIAFPFVHSKRLLFGQFEAFVRV